MTEKLAFVTDVYLEPDGPSEGMPRADVKQITYAGRVLLSHDQTYQGSEQQLSLMLPPSVADRVVSYYEKMNEDPSREANCHGFADYTSGWHDSATYRRELKDNYEDVATPATDLRPGKAYTIISGSEDYNRHSLIALNGESNLSVLGYGQPLTITANADLINHFAPEGGALHELREPQGIEKHLALYR
jgi:hypothetical protein